MNSGNGEILNRFLFFTIVSTNFIVFDWRRELVLSPVFVFHLNQDSVASARTYMVFSAHCIEIPTRVSLLVITFPREQTINIDYRTMQDCERSDNEIKLCSVIVESVIDVPLNIVFIVMQVSARAYGLSLILCNTCDK